MRNKKHTRPTNLGPSNPNRPDLQRQRPYNLDPYTQSEQTQQVRTRRRSAPRKGSRLLAYICGLVAILFVAVVFLFRDQIVAPLTTDAGGVEQVAENTAQNVGQAINAIEASAVEGNSNDSVDNTNPATASEVSDEKSPSAQLADTSLADVIAGVKQAEGEQSAPALSAAERASVKDADGGNSASADAAISTESAAGSSVTQVANALTPGTRFEINQSVDNDKVSNIMFTVRSAEVTADALILNAAFENVAEKATRFSRIDPVPLAQIRLLDAAGKIYGAQSADPTLLAIQPMNGFAPQGANIGQIRFALPTGPGPFTLSGIHNYPAIQITDEMIARASTQPPQGETVSAMVPDGPHDVYTQVTSSLQELKPLVLHVRTIDLTEDSLNLHIGFSNNTLQRFGLLSGPSGSNAWLLDKSQRQYAPQIVSESLRDLITPEQGIAPGDEYQGTLTFPRPSDLTELQFVLEPYTPIIVRFGPDGINEVTADVLNSASEYVSIPSASSSGVQAFREVSTLLDQTAYAVMTLDQEKYVDGFSTTQQPFHQAIFDRLGRLPLINFELELLVPAQLEGIDVQTSDSISTPLLDVQLKYTLRDISDDNPFVYDFTASFARVDGLWMVTDFRPKRNHPFWWDNDFSTVETAHFLIFTRPDSVQVVQNLQIEVENSYAALAARGIPLEDKYVAYFTGRTDSLYSLTGMANTHLVGVALSRYDINARDSGSGERTINAINRAFYVNSEQFALNQAAGTGTSATANAFSLRQSIITHELVHLAFAHSARPFTPPWLSEGIAVYYSEQFVLDDARNYARQGKFERISLAQLTGLETLGDHDLVGEETEMRYIYSSAVVSYLIELYGEAQVQALFRAYASIPAEYIEERIPAEQDAGTTRVAFRQMSIDLTGGYVSSYFGLTLPELDQRVKAWLAQ